MVAKKDDERTTSTDLDLPRADVQRFSDADLRQMADFEAAVAALGDELVSSADHIGSGAELLRDKSRLEGVPFVALQWNFSASKDYEGEYFVSVHVLTRHQERFIFNDGSKGGIRDQLFEYSQGSGRFSGMLCEKGLRSSSYVYEDADGKKKNATSYYIA